MEYTRRHIYTRVYSDTLLPALVHRAISAFTLLFPRGNESKKLYATIVIARSPRINRAQPWMLFQWGPDTRGYRDIRDRRELERKGGSRVSTRRKYYTRLLGWLMKVIRIKCLSDPLGDSSLTDSFKDRLAPSRDPLLSMIKCGISQWYGIWIIFPALRPRIYCFNLEEMKPRSLARASLHANERTSRELSKRCQQ